MAKTIFITGASSGLGKQTALLFSDNGWSVIATMRNPKDDLEFSARENIRVLSLDVTNPEQINSVVSELLNTTEVDVVFNNAGYGLAGPFEGASDEQILRQVNTNLLGVLRVTKAFVGYFRERGIGMFIQTTSIGGLVTFPLNSVYHATKWAIEGWSESLSYELEAFGIKVKTVAPGGISTDFAGRSLDYSVHPAYQKLIEKVMSVFSDPKRVKHHSTPTDIAAIVYQAVTDKSNKLRYVAGRDAKKLYKMRSVLGYKQYMKQIRKRFFGK